MKTLTIVSAGMERPDRMELLEKEANDLSPRVTLYAQSLNSDLLDEHYLQTIPPRWRRALYKFIPTLGAQLLEAYIVRNRYDLVVSWAERIGYPFALLLKLTRSRTPHITLNSWISGRKKALFLKHVHSHIDRILLWSTVQKDFAIQVLRIPPSKITFIRKFADQQFWRPMGVETDMICSAGMEMRDYVTLVKALKDLDIPCHIAAGAWRNNKYHPSLEEVYTMGPLPPTITIGKKDYFELREIYARSRFVVIPTHQTDTDNGLTCMLEAMAMGKAVIISRTKGQVDVLQDGVTGLYVPVGNPGALREAILHLWNNPHIAESMGRAARAYLEEHHTIQQFIESVKSTAEEVIRTRVQVRIRPRRRVAQSEFV